MIKEKLTPRAWPIVWGFLFLAFCGWIIVERVFETRVPSEVWVTLIVLMLGVTLLAVGVATAVRGRKSAVSSDGGFDGNEQEQPEEHYEADSQDSENS